MYHCFLSQETATGFLKPSRSSHANEKSHTMIFHLHETCLACCTLVSFIIFPVCITPHIIIASVRTHILIILCILQKNIYLHTANSTILVTILWTHFDIFSTNPFTVHCAYPPIIPRICPKLAL